MPLSEREQQLLDQMERALYEEDPRFVSQLRSGPAGRARRRRYLLAGLVLAAGLAVVVAGVWFDQVWVGVLGFAVMVGAGLYAVSPASTPLGTVRPDGSVRPAAARPRGLGATAARFTRDGSGSTRATRTTGTTGATFMQRLEQRWEERRERGEW